MDYKLTDRKFSRMWRRNKRYSEHELRWLARRRHLDMKITKNKCALSGPGMLVQFEAVD